MENSIGSNSIDKPWDHAWTTDEMRNNRRNWSLAGDSGLLKHLEEFSEKLIKKANDTRDIIDSMASQISETSILVDNIMNTSQALSNTQFIESRVQEDNIETEQPIDDMPQIEDDCDLNASDLLHSVCESIKCGLSIMDEKYEKIEFLASDSEDDDDTVVPSIILRAKDPYESRPLPYVFGTDQWEASSKVGLETSSSESEISNENQDSASDTEEKNIENILSSKSPRNLGIKRGSSTSSESNDEYNVEVIKHADNNKFLIRSQDIVNSETEPISPSSVLPTTQNVNNEPPSFAEELAKRLGSVLPSQKHILMQDSNEQISKYSQDDIFTSTDDQDIFTKSHNLFSEGKNLFFDQVPSSIKNPIRSINKNIIPPSIDVPPPLTVISSVPKSTIDDLFRDKDDSEDSDDIFCKKNSKDIFSTETKAVSSKVIINKKNPKIENLKEPSSISTNISEIDDKMKNLFEKEKDIKDDLFKVTDKSVQSSLTESTKKKAIGGVSVLGEIDILSSSKFIRRTSSSSSSEGDPIDHQIDSNSLRKAPIMTNNSNDKTYSIFEAGNNVNNSKNTLNDNNVDTISEIPIDQKSIDSKTEPTWRTDFQPPMTSSNPKTEEIYREHVVSDSLSLNGGKLNITGDNLNQQQQTQVENITGYDEIFGPPPLSKVASLFDDSDSDNDLFSSASTDSKSLSIDHASSKIQSTNKKSLFNDDDDLFVFKDALDVDLFTTASVKNSSNISNQFFDENGKPVSHSVLFDDGKCKNNTVSSLSRDILSSEKTLKYSANTLFSESSINDNDSKISGGNSHEEDLKAKSDDLFDKDLKISDNNLFKKNSNSIDFANSTNATTKQSPNDLFKESQQKVENIISSKNSKGIFDDSDDFIHSDLFSDIPKQNRTIIGESSGFLSNSKNLFGDDPDSDLFGTSSKGVIKTNIDEISKENIIKTYSSDIFENRSKILKPKKLSTSIFDDSDEEDQDLFSGFNFAKKIDTKKMSNIFEEKESTSTNDNIVKNKTKEGADLDIKKIMKSTLKAESKNNAEDESTKLEIKTKNFRKISLFDDNDDIDVDDDSNDLFGVKKKGFVQENDNTIESEKSEFMDSTKEKQETKLNVDESQDPIFDLVSKKAMFVEIKEKLEKHKLKQTEKDVKSETSTVVDSAASSKKEPPNVLKIHRTPPDHVESLENQQDSKKSGMSGKIKDLMGKMNDLKILSPTDTPPILRKTNDEKINDDIEQKTSTDLESSESSSPSILSSESSPRASGQNSRRKDSSSKSDNTEIAISFDEPAQVETLTSITSKSRVRIQSKRRPQSRHARQSALRHSGIDFDVVDTIGNNASSDQLPSDYDPNSTVNRLLLKGSADITENSSSDLGHVDDKSELSISRNTATNLLSPSTDEEDLFDVPPDLPEDSAVKEDSLFGRAPILSPVANFHMTDNKVKSASNNKEQLKGEAKEPDDKKDKKIEAIDPLRDNNHDPLEDPSQLFAFVTKTPSPDKHKGLLSNKEDDSLFSSSSKSFDKTIYTKSKPVLDLFIDDDDTSGSDLFSSRKSKIKIKSKDTNTNLLEDIISEDDDLFQTANKIIDSTKSDLKSLGGSSVASKKIEKRNTNITKAKDVYSDDEDIFASTNKQLKNKNQSIFEGDENNSDDDIFGKPKSSFVTDKKPNVDNQKVMAKKSITKDLKKTAKTIVEDPLSIMQND